MAGTRHWHDGDDGHRAQCKGAQALKKRMKDENLIEKWINKAPPPRSRVALKYVLVEKESNKLE